MTYINITRNDYEKFVRIMYVVMTTDVLVYVPSSAKNL